MKKFFWGFWLNITMMLVSTCIYAKTIIVGVNKDFNNITSAMNAARPFDTIKVLKGLYFEKNLIISKPIVLLGINKPILDGERKFEVISVKSDHVIISGFIIRNSGISSVVDFAGIKIYESKDVTIENNTILDAFFGIYTQYGFSCTIRNNLILAHGLHEQQSGNGIHCWNCDSMKIYNNQISGHRDGIYFEFVKNSKIKENHSYKNLRYGLHFMFSNDDEYEKNIFNNNGAGVAVMFSKKVNMYHNYFQDNWGDASYGILLKEISDGKIENNTFKANTTGIYMEGSSRISMTKNNFLNNGWGMKIQASCMDIIIHHNNFIENTFDVSTNGSLVLNDFDKNYWDKYEGYDLNKDQLGDIPYRPVSLFSVILEKYPTTMIMFRSFISMLMDKTEKMIPSLTPVNLLDNQPLLKQVR